MTRAQLVRINFPIENLKCEILMEFNLSVKLWLANETACKKHSDHYDPVAVRNEHIRKIEKLDEISEKLSNLRAQLEAEVALTPFDEALDRASQECKMLSDEVLADLY